jgi:hypothetical protein
MAGSNTMSMHSSLLPGKGSFVFASDNICFETKKDSVTIPISSIKHTILYKRRGWILCEDATHTFKAPASWVCPWGHSILKGTQHRGECVSGIINDDFFIGDNHHGHLSKVWDFACIQRLSRWSTTFDVVWLDVETSHAFEVTYTKDEKDAVMRFLDARAIHIIDIGADPYTWSQACRVAKSEAWQIEDWLYLFSDESEPEDEDSDWQPPSKRLKQAEEEESEEASDSDDEAYAI